MSKRFPPHNLFKSVDRVILDRYLGFSFFEIDDYISIKFKSMKNVKIVFTYVENVVKMDIPGSVMLLKSKNISI